MSPIRMLFALGGLLLATSGRAVAADAFEEPPIRYSARTPRDRVAALQARIARGEWRPTGDAPAQLAALLRELDVPISSQLLVFSRTSLQRTRIRPDHPRAIYFNDSCYVGWVPGGLIEVTAIDPELGPVFYAFSPAAAARGRPAFEREADCLRCHGGTFVRDVPAVFARSVFPAADGEPLLRQGTVVVDYRTPFAERWGGWYVTGRHGLALHRGNQTAREEGDALVFDPAAGANVTDLAGRLDLSAYPVRTSDIVALLVFEHQLAVQNAITRAGFATRRMIDYQRNLQRAFHEPESDEPSYDSVRSVVSGAAREVVDALLAHGEATLPDGVAGDPAFSAAFEAAGPRTASGASLRELALAGGRVFRNRCSPLIYSEAFLGLPVPLLRGIYKTLHAALESPEGAERYRHLDAAERARLTVILRETHAGYAAFAAARPGAGGRVD